MIRGCCLSTCMTAESVIASQLEKLILREMKARLINWGRWWYQESDREINRLTGYRYCSTLALIMHYAPVIQRSGYASPYAAPLNTADAVIVQQAIERLSVAHRGELVRYYVAQELSGTPQQQARRRRAMLKLAALL